MSSIITLSISLLLLLVVGLSLAADGPTQGSRDPCVGVKCPRPLCADPITPRGQCCPTCAHSRCKFEGCVQLKPRLTWYPNPCSPSICREGRTIRGIVDCFPQTNIQPEDCFGFPVSPMQPTPTRCCPRCEFGVPENACRAVPSEEESFIIKHSTSTCRGSLTVHECDKIGYREDGKIFRCDPVLGSRSIPTTGRGCDPFKRVTYEDTISCKPVEDDTVNADGCDLVVRSIQGERGHA